MMDYVNSETVNESIAAKRLEAIYKMSRLLSAVEADAHNIDAILPDVFEVALELFQAHDASILLVNEDLEVTRFWHASDPNFPHEDAPFVKDVMARGLANWVIENKRAHIVHNTQQDRRWIPHFPDHLTIYEPWSIACTPFMKRSDVIGAVTIIKPGENQFNDDDLEVLNVLGNQATDILEKVRILEESKRQLRISSLLNEASRSINSSLDLDVVMQSMLAQMNEFLNAEAISIALVDKQTNELVYQVAAGIGSDDIVGLRLPSNQGISGWVMEHSQAALVQDAGRDPRLVRTGDERTGYQTRAMICAPMRYKTTVLGTIQAINPIGGTFTEQELELLVNLANIASSAIANAQQHTLTLAAETRYTSLFQDSIDPILITDLTGKILEANRRAFAFLGYPEHRLLSKKIGQLHVEEAALPPIKRLEANSIRVFNSQLITQNGRRVHVEVYAKRTSYGENEFVQWIYHDISQQIELEEMRKDLQAMLFHDLQSPLGNVISSLELLTYEIPEDSSPAMIEMLDIAIRSSSRLQTLIRSLLDINQLEAGHPITEQNRVKLHTLVGDAWETVRPSFEKRNIPLVQKVPSDLPDVYVEDDMIRRVLVNLMDNAVKYSPDSKQITVAAELNEDSMVQVSVCDQGEGIPESLRTAVFEKFRRIKTDTYSKGLGLGLAFCRLTVEAHGGRIWVDDAPGGGSRFNFTLPRWQEKDSLA
jgi:two-component system, NtrC family, sensor histidine kinase KinB